MKAAMRARALALAAQQQADATIAALEHRSLLATQASASQVPVAPAQPVLQAVAPAPVAPTVVAAAPVNAAVAVAPAPVAPIAAVAAPAPAAVAAPPAPAA